MHSTDALSLAHALSLVSTVFLIIIYYCILFHADVRSTLMTSLHLKTASGWDAGDAAKKQKAKKAREAKARTAAAKAAAFAVVDPAGRAADAGGAGAALETASVSATASAAASSASLSASSTASSTSTRKKGAFAHALQSAACDVTASTPRVVCPH